MKIRNRLRFLMWSVIFALILLPASALSLEQPPAITNSTHAGKVWVPGWKSAPPISKGRTGHGALVIKDVLHIIGGADKETYFSATEYSRINKDGSLTSWSSGEHGLNIGRAFHGVAQVGRYVYVVGGSRADVEGLLDSAERAEIKEDGTIGEWTLEKTKLNIPRRCVHLAVIGGYVYAVGGFGGKMLDSIERARVEEDGSLSEWEMLIDGMHDPRYVHAVKAVGDRLYVLGGHDKSGGFGISSAEWAQTDGEGMFYPWELTKELQQIRFGLEAAIHGEYIYSLGGIDGIMYLSSIEKGRLSKDGGVTGWKYTTSLPEARGSFGSAVSKDAIYIVSGSTDKDLTNEVAYAFFNDQGDIGYWGTQDEADKIKNEKAERLRKVEHKYPNKAKIIERLRAGRISFLKVQRKDGMMAWLAVPAGGYMEGMHLRFSNGNMVTNHFSKSLNRRFRALMFVRDLYPVEALER